MIRPVAFLLVLACLSGPGWADESRPSNVPVARVVAIPAGAVPPNRWVTLDASQTVGDDVQWMTDVDDSLYREDTGKRLIYLVPPGPGLYQFTVDVASVVDGKIVRNRARIKVECRDLIPDKPDDGTRPKPPPIVPIDPINPPFAGKINVAFVYSDSSVNAGPILNSRLGKMLESLNCSYRAVSSGGADGVRFNPRLRSDKLIADDGRLVNPVAYLMDDAGVVLGFLPSPSSPDAIVSEVARIRSGGK